MFIVMHQYTKANSLYLKTYLAINDSDSAVDVGCTKCQTLTGGSEVQSCLWFRQQTLFVSERWWFQLDVNKYVTDALLMILNRIIKQFHNAVAN